jgi:hypothetical protein
MNMANCRMKIDTRTKTQTVVTSRIVVIWVRQNSPRSRTSILQKWMDIVRTILTNTRMTLMMTAMPCATEESDTVVKPLSLVTALDPCLAPWPSPSESNNPKAENVPNVLFAANIEIDASGWLEVREREEQGKLKMRPILIRRALTNTGNMKASAVSMILLVMGRHFPTFLSIVIAHQMKRLCQDVMIHFIVLLRDLAR